MNKETKRGDVVTRTTPTGGYTGGTLVIIRSGTSGKCGIPLQDYDAGDTAVLKTKGAVKVPKDTGVTLSFGALAYRNATGGKATSTATGNTLAGTVRETAGTSATEVWLDLNE